MAATSAATEDARAAGIAAFLTQVNPKGSATMNAYTATTGSASVESIPTGALTLDLALGVGGMPKGRLIELYGPESSGKTSLALSAIGQAIKGGGVGGYVDVENAINFDHVRKMGVDLDYFVLSQPNSGEEALQMMETMARSGLYKGSIIALDSIAALVPQKELEGDIGDTHVGLTARLMSQGLRKLAQVAAQEDVTMIFINQLREKIGVMMGNPETTPGGKAMKFYASVRLDVRSAAGVRIKEGTGVNEKVIGQKCTVTVKKNKVGVPFKKAEYNLYFDRGIDTVSTIVDAAVKSNVWVAKPGGNYYDAVSGESVGRGKDNIEAELAARPEWAAQVTEQVRAAMTTLPVDMVEDDVDDKFEAMAERFDEN